MNGTLQKCDICKLKEAIADCRLKAYSGAWGNVCRKCFDAYECEIGLGKGQLLQTGK